MGNLLLLCKGYDKTAEVTFNEGLAMVLDKEGFLEEIASRFEEHPSGDHFTVRIYRHDVKRTWYYNFKVEGDKVKYSCSIPRPNMTMQASGLTEDSVEAMYANIAHQAYLV